MPELSIQQVKLPGALCPTSRLGYGCSGLMGGISRRASRKLLEQAYAEGITHFDTAPSYGAGEAEACLGTFVRHCTGPVTITTKVGRAPSRPGRLLTSWARRTARKALRSSPNLLERARGVAGAAGSSTAVPLTAAEAERTLNASRLALGVDRLDVWLIHELVDLGSAGFEEFLRETKGTGTVGAIGYGGNAADAALINSRYPGLCDVLQHEWSILDAASGDDDPFRIHHRALHGALPYFDHLKRSDPALIRDWSLRIDADLSDGATLAALLLRAALEMNPGNIILFSSRDARNISAAAAAVREQRFREPAVELWKLISRPAHRLAT